MILADTSIWIELARGRRALAPTEGMANMVTCGPVAQELLQGMSDSPINLAFRRDFLALPFLSDPVPRSLYLAAAEIYRAGRRRGMTIRSAADCLIAAIAIENRVPVWHRDRDYDLIARFTPLRTICEA